MTRLAASVVLAGVALVGVTAPAFATKPPAHHEQADGCDHGATSKPCRPDPQPTHGKDCETHGNHGGINEDHCAPAPSPTTTGGTPSATSTAPSTPTSSNIPTSPTGPPSVPSSTTTTRPTPSTSRSSSAPTPTPEPSTESPTPSTGVPTSTKPASNSTAPLQPSPLRSVPSSTGALPRTGFDPRLTGLGAVLLLAGCGSWVARRRGEH